jgi:hypothetical protein
MGEGRETESLQGREDNPIQEGRLRQDGRTESMKPIIEVDVYPIIPPVGKIYKWGAKCFYWDSEHGRAVRVFITAEYMGETKEKAEQNARRAYLDQEKEQLDLINKRKRND